MLHQLSEKGRSTASVSKTKARKRTRRRQSDSEGRSPGRAKGGAREAAVRILNRVEESDSYLDKLLEHELRSGQLNKSDKALLTELTNGVQRWRARLDWILAARYRGAYHKCQIPIKNALRIALYQIMMLDKIPQSAAVNESVEIIKRSMGIRPANLVNAVLRAAIANKEEVRYPDKDSEAVRFVAINYAHPEWMVQRWLDRFGEQDTIALLEANNLRPRLTLRIHENNKDAGSVTTLLDEKNINYRESPWNAGSLLLASMPHSLAQEILQQGRASVQDVSASLATRLAAPSPGDTVYDLCAAPGGKTVFLAELMRDQGQVIALDKYSAKLAHIKANAKRLHLNSIECLTADAREWQSDTAADVVVADVPCSGLGTLSKIPEIKWKRDVQDIQQLADIQREILANAARMVKIGGALLYSTCTIEAAENQEIAAWFLQNHSNYRLDPAERILPSELCSDGFLETLPHKHQMHGAFAARFVREN